MTNDPSSDPVARLVAYADPALLIVTAAEGGRREGCLVGFSTQVSIDPAWHLVCVSEKNRTHELALRADLVGIHAVPAGRRDLAALFGGETGDELDKFERCEWSEGPEGVPLLDACPMRYVGRVVERIALGDHTGVVLEAAGAPGPPAEAPREGPLRLSEAERIEPGHEA
jgi:flavin reductase (DIM6/NTAB) family NADH-FMN oxidoreductase RutF